MNREHDDLRLLCALLARRGPDWIAKRLTDQNVSLLQKVYLVEDNDDEYPRVVGLYPSKYVAMQHAEAVGEDDSIVQEWSFTQLPPEVLRGEKLFKITLLLETGQVYRGRLARQIELSDWEAKGPRVEWCSIEVPAEDRVYTEEESQSNVYVVKQSDYRPTLIIEQTLWARDVEHGREQLDILRQEHLTKYGLALVPPLEGKGKPAECQSAWLQREQVYRRILEQAYRDLGDTNGEDKS
jgi:hypothetical protein